jgi:hypothetical protein
MTPDFGRLSDLRNRARNSLRTHWVGIVRRLSDLRSRARNSLRTHWVSIVTVVVLAVGVVVVVVGLVIWSSDKPDSTTALPTSEVDWVISLVGVYGLIITVGALVIALREARLSAQGRADAESAMLQSAEEAASTRRLLLAVDAGVVDAKEALNIIAKIQPLARLDTDQNAWEIGSAIVAVGQKLGEPLAVGEVFREHSDTNDVIILPTDSHGLWRLVLDADGKVVGQPVRILETDGKPVVSAHLQAVPRAGLAEIRARAADEGLRDAAFLFPVDVFRRRSRGSQRFAVRDSASNWWDISVANRTGAVTVELRRRAERRLG